MISQGETTFFFVKINGLIAELKMELNRSPTDLELQRRLEQAAAVMIQAAARKMICRAAFRRARLMMNDGRKVQTPIARPRFPKPGNKAKAGVDAAQESSPTLLLRFLIIRNTTRIEEKLKGRRAKPLFVSPFVGNILTKGNKG